MKFSASYFIAYHLKKRVFGRKLKYIVVRQRVCAVNWKLYTRLLGVDKLFTGSVVTINKNNVRILN